MIRVLVTLSPLMYRQAVALSVQRNRPGLVEVRLAPPEAMEAEIASFGPHLLVHDDTRGDPRRGFAPSLRLPWRQSPTASRCSTQTAWTCASAPTGASPRFATPPQRI